MNFECVEDMAKDETVFISFYQTTDKKNYGLTVFKNVKTINYPHWECIQKKTGKAETPIELTLQKIYKEIQETIPGKGYFVFDSFLRKGDSSGYPVIQTPNFPYGWMYAERDFFRRYQPLEDQIAAYRDDLLLTQFLSIHEDLLVYRNPFHEQESRNLLEDFNSDLPTEFPITQSFLLFYTYLRAMFWL
jgi:hypothetical protein